MIAGGVDTGIKTPRRVRRESANLSAGGEPYQLKRGDCAKAHYRDEWALLVKDPSVLAYMPRQSLARKLLEAARIIGELRKSAA